MNTRPSGTSRARPSQRAAPRKSGRKLRYLIQKHDASRLHYDFRIEWNGTLMSWAVPKGPSENPNDKRLAVHVEDHPVEYGNFEGTIPQDEYGGGTVMLWDTGTWEPQDGVDVDEGLRKGKLAFLLHGKRLQGKWALVRLRARSKNDKDNWLLIKELDDHVRRERQADHRARNHERQIRPRDGGDRRRQERQEEGLAFQQAGQVEQQVKRPWR